LKVLVSLPITVPVGLQLEEMRVLKPDAMRKMEEARRSIVMKLVVYA